MLDDLSETWDDEAMLPKDSVSALFRAYPVSMPHPTQASVQQNER